MEALRIAVLFGGCSPEYEVSLQSAHAVITHLNRERYEPVLIGITRQGDWFRYCGPADGVADDTWFADEHCIPAVVSPSRDTHGLLEFHAAGVRPLRIDVAFSVLHGRNGEDGTVQGLLELAGIPIVGCDTLCSALCMDKQMAHAVAAQAGVAVPPSVVVHKGMGAHQILERVSALAYPLFVKPARAGSSFGITKALQEKDVLPAVQTALAHDRKVIIEEAVNGFEVGCAVLGNDDLVMGEVDEIELTQGFFDYEEKYTLKTSRIHMPARIGKETATRIKQTAATLYRALGCRGFARVDLFLTPEEAIVFNEVNTIPGLTTHSRYPNMMKGIGMDLPQILDTLIGLAVAEWQS